VTAPRFQPTSVEVGESFEVGVTASGGLGPYRFTWSGLPPGCPADSAVVSCTVESAGQYRASVTVTDDLNFSVRSKTSVLTVSVVSPAVAVLGLAPVQLMLAVLIAGLSTTLMSLVVGSRWSGRKRSRTPTGGDGASVR
jgi:hypothetical protein